MNKYIIKKGESRKVEFKESLSLKDEIGENISAFSNAGGGTIFVGVSDSGEIKGLHIGAKTIEDLANFIKQNTDNQNSNKEQEYELNEMETKVIVYSQTFEKNGDVTGGVTGGVSEGVNSLLNLIETDPGNRAPYFSDELHKPLKTIERWLKKLRDGNRIEFRGSSKKGGYYEKKG